MYDRFHEKAKNIYRIIEERHFTEVPRHFATSYIPLSIHLNNDYPEIKTVRFQRFEGQVSYGNDKHFTEKRFFYADSSIFSVFDFRLLSGDPQKVLSDPFSVVITVKTAPKYFGDDNPLGKMLLIDKKLPFRVTGIVENPPANSHIKFDFLASFSTINRILS